MTGTIAGEGDSQVCLEWLERNNLFLLSVDEDRRWFRYHHLFRKLLLDQLERQHGQRGHKRAACAGQRLV